ncbi:MAG: hypothetical protein DCC75_09010 [Proteobacteria bacterium]|nr:MAG: hypothetical protein DCC75_09010 [Pseudomonadota bacterium]
MKDIIIIEDGAQERSRLEKLFADAGYSVATCGSVGEAEKHVKLSPFRVAVLDIGLSDKSGSYLFGLMRREGRVSYIVIYTGNPSVHLKQRFMEEGAADYIVKGSPQAQGDNLLTRIRELIGNPQASTPNGIGLEEFLAKFVSEKSRSLFLESDGSFAACPKCQRREYQVIFSQQTQVPPDIKGQVVCAGCGSTMQTDVG